MFTRFILRMKIYRLSTRIKSIEALIMRYRYDQELKNQIYYCGSGDVDAWVDEMSHMLFNKVVACQRLMNRYEKRLDELDGVVG